MKGIVKPCLIVFHICLFILAAHSALGAEYIFPQVADGTSGTLTYITAFLINNLSNTANTVTISFYLGGLKETHNGQPWVLDLRCKDRADIAGRNFSFTFSLAAGETVNVYTNAFGFITTGWARIQTTAPINVSEIFSAVRPDLLPQRINWEAGVLATPVATRFSLEANVSADETVAGTSVNTGYAIVNPNASPANIVAALFSPAGTLMGQPKTVTLPPNGQLSEFVSERFSDIQLPASFHGVLRLSSDVNIALCALRWSLGPNTDVFSAVAVNPDFTLGYHTYHDLEPTSSKESAQPISLPAEVVGAKNALDANADGDWFAVNLQANQTVYVLLVADIMGSAYDGDISLFDSQGTLLKRVDSWASGLGDAALDHRVPSSGTYYVMVMSRTGGSTRGSAYRLYVTAR